MTIDTPAAPRRGGRLGALDAIAWAGMFAFGIVMALLGATLPVLTGRLSLGLGDIGTLFLAMNAAMLAASLLVGPVMDRFGMKGPLTFGAAVVAGALVTIAAASRWGQLLPAVVCLGFGGGVLNAGTNTLVADVHDDPETKASALNLLGVFFGFGALFLPFTIFVLAHGASRGMLSGGEIAALIVGGVVLHIPVAALFVVPFLRRRRTAA